MSRRYLLMVGGDLLLAFTLLVAVNMLLIQTTLWGEVLPQLEPLMLLLFCLLVIAAKYGVELFRFYRSDRDVFRRSLLRIVGATLLPALLLITSYAISPHVEIPPSGLELALILFCLIQVLIVYRIWFAGQRVRHLHNVLVFGSGPLAMWIADSIKEEGSRHRFSGFIQPGSPEPASDAKECPPEILEAVKGKQVATIVVALAERRGVLPVRDMFSCKLRGIEVVDAVTFYERTTGKLLLEHIKPSWFVFNKGFRVTRLMFLKQRLIDVLASALLLLLTLPLFPLLALAIRLESPGPVFFRQTRVGFKEKPFELIKFRTMRDDAEQESGAVWASENDDRITRLGRILRKFRIDELPQLFNVLKGEMSFIGPRPERPEFVDRLSRKVPYYSRRHAVRPGLTGWAQVRYPYGASDEDALEKLRYDLYFIKNFSLILELKIIIGTVKVVLFGKGGR